MLLSESESVDNFDGKQTSFTWLQMCAGQMERKGLFRNRSTPKLKTSGLVLPGIDNVKPNKKANTGPSAM